MAYNSGASSGNLVLIQEQVASASASIDFTTGITGYDIYYLSYYGVILSGTADLYLSVSTDGGSSYSTSNYVTNGWENGGSSFNPYFFTGSPGALMGHFLGNNGGTIPLDASAFIYHFGSSSFYKQIAVFQNNFFFASGNNGYGSFSTNWQQTTVVNAFQLIPQSGTITSGTFKLYGVQN